MLPGPGPSPFGGKGTRQSGTNADLPGSRSPSRRKGTKSRTKSRSRVSRRRRSSRIGAESKGNRIHARHPKRSIRRAYLDVLRSEFDPNPKCPPWTSRNPWTGRRRWEKKSKQLRRFVFRIFDENVRQSSAFVLSDVEI